MRGTLERIPSELRRKARRGLDQRVGVAGYVALLVALRRQRDSHASHHVPHRIEEGNRDADGVALSLRANQRVSRVARRGERTMQLTRIDELAAKRGGIVAR